MQGLDCKDGIGVYWQLCVIEAPRGPGSLMSQISSFRQDIEGLRALAVLLVVACHVGIPGFQGGYVGVDVFFVISGYLITRLLVIEHFRTGRINLVDFYARRIRRLLPALMVMLLAVLVLIRLLYSPLEQPGKLQSVFAAAVYFSNLHFAAGATDYWGASAKLDPLLHTWSLGVEEQFYLAWPLLLIALLALSRKALPLVVWGSAVLLMVLSLGLATLWTQTRQPDAFFYPFTRAWEFGAGALLVPLEWYVARQMPHAPLGRLVKGLLLAGGMVAILGAVVTYDGQTPFPGLAAMLPVTGAVLIIAVGSLSSGTAPFFLTLPVMQWLGRMSYGWYLWHWPFLVVGRLVIREPAIWLLAVIAMAALVPAALSYHLVEKPVRQYVFFRKKRVALVMAVLFPLLCVVIVGRMDASAMKLAESKDFSRYLAIRWSAPSDYAAGCDRWYSDTEVIKCVAGKESGAKTAVLLGDSHAGQWFSAFNEVMKEKGWQLVFVTKSACPIVNASFFYEKIGRIYRECEQWRARALMDISSMRPDLIIVSGSENYPFSPGEWKQGTLEALAPLAAASKRLVILRDTPLPRFDVPDCLARHQWQPAIFRGDCSFQVENSLSPMLLQMHRRIAEENGKVGFLDMTPHICPGGTCTVDDGTVIKYRDGNHLSDRFVRTLVPALKEELARQGVF